MVTSEAWRVGGVRLVRRGARRRDRCAKRAACPKTRARWAGRGGACAALDPGEVYSADSQHASSDEATVALTSVEGQPRGGVDVRQWLAERL